jgi:hypothetical protein
MDFPKTWIRPKDFEDLLLSCASQCDADEITLRFPKGCKLLIDTVLRILSFVNQLTSQEKKISFDFQDLSLYQYLDRMGFFQALDNRITINPKRPTNILNPGKKNSAIKALPGKLADQLVNVLGLKKSRSKEFNCEVFTVLSELINNFYDHSESPIPGFVVAQTYSKTNKVRIAISDSGLGITMTIRRDRPKDFKKQTDSELLVAAFNEGVSRHGQNVGRGCGLYRCSQISLKYSADLYIRTPTDEVHLRPARSKNEQNVAFCRSQLGNLSGTHLSLEFALDN